MKSLNTARTLFRQIGLDSGSLTMLGIVVNSFSDPGEYRGTVYKEGENKGVFYISVDKNSPVAQANIDLAAVTESAPNQSEEACKCAELENRFSVNPRGYVLFHVSCGPGGYNVRVRKADEDEDTKIFDSRKLSKGAIFAATILRPGSYSVTNKMGKGKAAVVVSYPRKHRKAYRPPEPVRVKTKAEEFYPKLIKLKPAQGLIFEIESSARIKIDLMEPDDGPKKSQKAS